MNKYLSVCEVHRFSLLENCLERI